MRLRVVPAVLILISGSLVMPAWSQGDGRSRPADWSLHNIDLRNSRYSPLEEINTSNVGRLALKWSFEVPASNNISSATPLVVDGVMYVHSGSKVFAVDTTTGRSLWTFEGDEPFAGTGRGPAYGDGRIYAYGQSVLYAVDTKSGEPIRTPLRLAR